MIIEKSIVVEGKEYCVVISDESEALLAAKAAGRAVLGLEGMLLAWSAVDYLIESVEVADDTLLERVVRRKFGLPWRIAETKRLMIREFCAADAQQIPKEASDTKADQIFQNPEMLADYIRCQYGFYEFGVWALVEKKNGVLIGKAGLSLWEDEEATETDAVMLELGYHIFEPYRKRGYAREACLAILEYAKNEWDDCRIYAKIDASNEASIRVAEACGFIRLNQTCNGAWQYSYQGVPYL